MPDLGRLEIENLVKTWLKRSAERAGYDVVGKPQLRNVKAGPSAFGHPGFNCEGTVTVRQDAGADARKVLDALTEIPLEDNGVTGEAQTEDLITLHFRLAVQT